jgi:hypothetical protein
MSTATSISFHCEYTLLRANYQIHTESLEPHTFSQTHKSGRTVTVTISYSAGTAVASMAAVDATEGVITELLSLGPFDGAKLSETTRAVIDAPLEEMRATMSNLLALVKYHLRHFDLDESSLSSKGAQWRAGSGELHRVPTTLLAVPDNFSSRPLDDRSRKEVQAALEGGALPLRGMRHLHRAKRESQPHHKWIDATIAAELGVKEAICRAHPEMETMLMEMPSPPLAKMYGPLLKHYLGEPSPFRKELDAGQAKRNALVHRPGADPIDRKEANDYVAVVEGAIFHLLSLLYPDDQLIRKARSLCYMVAGKGQ